MSRKINIAAAAYNMEPLVSADAYQNKIHDWVEEAAHEGAELLVFPEYGSMELATLAGKDVSQDAIPACLEVSDRLDLQAEVHARLARDFGVHIVSASGPCCHSDGSMTNVARIFAPNGQVGEYHKIMPTPGERNLLGLAKGPDNGLVVFDIGIAKIGLLICYDIEFPLLSRALAEAGAEIILAPSNTELEHGYWRVRTGCMARALENQVYTVHAPTVGSNDWCSFVDENTGAAGVFAPSDHGFSAGGIVALGEMNVPGWVHATLDLEHMRNLREAGGVQTFEHWKEQPGVMPLPEARVVSLA